MAKNESHVRVRCGVRIFLECNRGKYYSGIELSKFLNGKLGMRGGAVSAVQIARLVSMDKTNMNGVLYPVDVKIEDNRQKYAIL